MIEVMRAYQATATLSKSQEDLMRQAIDYAWPAAELGELIHARSFHRRDRHAGPADQCGSDRQQSGEHEHHGFKEQRAEFTDLLYQNIQTPGSQTSDQGTYAPNGIQMGAGVRTAAIYRITTQGDLQSTGNPYDVAIQGPGYFRIQQADGTDAYTRSGNFSLCPQGQLVTQDGLVVQPGIAIPQNTLSVTINAQGQVNATVAGNYHAPDRGPAGTDALPQRSGPQCRRQQPLSGDAGVGFAPGRRSGFDRLRHHPAGLSGNLQCQLGGRDHRPDHRPARL